jgi:hypothetical protein
LSYSKKNVNMVRNVKNMNTIWKRFKSQLRKDYEKIKMHLFASSKKNVNVLKNGYIFLHDWGNLLGSLQFVCWTFAMRLHLQVTSHKFEFYSILKPYTHFDKILF